MSEVSKAADGGMNWLVGEAIKQGRFDVIPDEYKSKRFEDENPWPPAQFIDVAGGHERFCTWCGVYFDMWSAPTFEPGEATCDVMIATHHACERYGKHCRHKDLPKDAYYMRVTSFGSSGRHHLSDDKEIQFVMVTNLGTGKQRFREIRNTIKRKAIHVSVPEIYNPECICDCYDCCNDEHCGKSVCTKDATVERGHHKVRSTNDWAYCGGFPACRECEKEAQSGLIAWDFKKSPWQRFKEWMRYGY